MRPPQIPAFFMSKRAKIISITIAIIIVLLIVLSSLVGVYINWLWFGSVGFRSVYRSVIELRVVLLLIFGVIMALGVGANLVVAYLVRPPFRPVSPEQQNLERYRVVLEPRKRLILAAVMVIFFLIAGTSAEGNWKTWMLWLNGGSFGIKDLQFHKDISFFAWDYPVYRTLLGFGFTMIIFSIIGAVIVHYLFGAIRLQTPGPKVTMAARRHLTVLIFLFIVLKAIAYWLDRYGLVYSDRGKVTGASYTDVNASLPAKTILFWMALIIAVLVLASIWLSSAQLPAIGFVLVLVLSIIINGIYPAIVQQFTVKPNASAKEATYISRNIEATSQAYGIEPGSNVTYSTYNVQSSPSTNAIVASNPTVSDLRILDPNRISATFTQQQRIKNVYGFPDKLDVDRYTVDGVTRDYIVGVRELNAAGLTGDQTNWINEHTVYTHGDGFVAAPADEDVTNNKNLYTEANIPPTGPLGLTQPAEYYGELLPNYSIVGAQGTKQEYDGSDGPKVSYQGPGGVSLSSFFTRLAFAVNYKQTNFILNSSASAKGAKLIYNRNPRQIISKVAPFLTVDSDPYPIVDPTSGHIVWIVDAYTTMSNYPYSEKESLSTLTSDSLSTTGRTASQPNDQINYIRNSVKATVDAYTGKVTLYDFDSTDPVLKAWSKAFPGLIQPESAMPASIKAHIRYPEDLFEIQRYLIGSYHVTNPVTFYNVGDKWTVPTDPNDSSASQPPYYVLASPPSGNSTKPEFQLTTPMIVNNNQNLAAYISVDSDPGANYGKITVLKVPSSTVVNGPEQVANILTTNSVITKDLSLFNASGGGSQVLHGNLLTLPIGSSYLYLEPLYVQAASGNGSYPTLQRVLVVYGDKIGYAADLSDALANLSQSQVGESLSTSGTNPTSTPSATPSSTPSSSPSSTSTSGTPTSSATTVSGTVAGVLKQLDTVATQLQNDYKTGDFTAIGADTAQLQQLLTQYLALTGTTPTSTPSSSATPSSSPSATPSSSATSTPTH